MNKNVQIKIQRQKNILISCFVIVLSLIMCVNAIAANSLHTNMEAMIQQKKITLNIKNKPAKYILSEIGKIVGIGYLIRDEVNIESLKNLSINVKDVTVEEALKTLLQNTGCTYQIDDNIIVVTKKVEIKNPVKSNQKVTVDGQVIGAVDNKPIAGATIIVLGTTGGDISDVNGRFKITIQKGQKIEVSYMGMQSQELVVEDSKQLRVILQNDAMALDDVVITGYGDVKKSSYTGNSITVKRDQLLKASKTNVIKALQSFDPSFRIKENNQWGSDPNALPEVYIRGESGMGVKELDKDALSKSSLKSNPNLPTFIMDGFEISVTKLYDFDPNRIESVTILKDAAATALYGSRAANGVVIITTVAPKPGKLNISYNFVGDITYPDLSDYNLMNSAEKLELERRAGCFLPDGSVGSNYSREVEYNEKLANVKRGVDTYWLSQPLRTVFNHKHSLYVDGGSENFRFGFDVNYANQDGVMKGSVRDRMGAGLSLNYIYKTLSIQNYVSYSQARSKESPFGNFDAYGKALPYDEFKDSDGKYYEALRSWGTESNDVDKTNPLYESTLKNYSKSLSEDFINNFSINWNITKDLLFKGQFSVTKVIGQSDRFLDPLSKDNTNTASLSNLSSGELYLNNSKGFTIDATAYLSYNKSVEKHNFNIMAGTNIKEDNESSYEMVYMGFPSGVLNSPNYAEKIYEKPTFDEGTTRLVGFLATMNYSYDDTYLLDASCRIDGSSAFGSDKRFAPFWSFGLGLNIHNYKFLRGSKVVNQLKIRGSYGQTGKANFPAYAARTSYMSLTDEWYKTGFGVVLQALGNENLAWETTNTLDAGVEVSLFQNIVYLKGSFYNKKTVDLVNDVTIPSASGFTTYRDNIGEIQNRGYEFDLRVSVLRRKDMSLIVNANMASNKNKILKISESLKAYNERVNKKFNEAGSFDADIDKPFLQYVEGGSSSSIWGMMSNGINPADGQEIFVRPNGTLTDKWVASNQMILGTTEPKGQGSLGLNFNYKRFSVYVSMMYEFGGQHYNQTLVNKVENANVYNSNVDRRVLTDRWEKPGDNAKYKSLLTGRRTPASTRPTSRFVQDYNMLSLSSISLGYDLSENALEKLGLGMVRFELGTNDLFNISTVKQERGLKYPFARVINCSVKVSF